MSPMNTRNGPHEGRSAETKPVTPMKLFISRQMYQNPARLQ